MGDVYSDHERLHEALELYNTSLKIYGKIKGKESVEYTEVLSSIGCVYDKLCIIVPVSSLPSK